MVKNWPRRTLNRIYAVIDHNDGVAKTTTTTQVVNKLSRQLLVPMEQKNENQTVMLGRENARVTEDVQPVNIVLYGNSCHQAATQPVQGVLKANWSDRPVLCEVRISADHAKTGVTHPTLQLAPPNSSPAVANIESNYPYSIRFHATSGKHNLTFLLANNQGGIANRIAFIEHPLTQDAPTRSTTHKADDATVPNSFNDHRTPAALGRVHDVNRAHSAGIDIRIHITAPTCTGNVFQHDVFIQNPPVKRRKDTQIVERNSKKQSIIVANDEITLLHRSKQFEFSAMRAHKKLVERTYDD